MDGNRGQKLRMLARQLQHVAVWNIKGASALDHPALRIIHLVVRKDHRGLERGFAHELQQPFRVEAVQVARQRAPGKSNVPQHERGERPAPAVDAQPASGPARAVADDVHVHIDRLFRRHRRERGI